ncbi:putative Alcohol dehydrogenase transcription factor Myb/SANT-like-containing protein 22 [Homarus americanus]|uniref:Putative Alcohol dehydrogenase transcription factor Myb/SANT-like-containing protein 22 n=2 Tax=Homarus americanus TaxID=6706 RepID=A0A8J5JSN2_HOMAM|nr:putative Alcohol dehydrogenase transcription factor Myb/SANT-like-containing protein 22 [Homarus americanus]
MLLIQQYGRFPELWNVSLMEYRNKEKKANAVKEIAKILNIPESEITRKWHNLRCQMNSEIRKLKKKKRSIGADDVVLKSTWEFFDTLHFMIGCNKPQGSTSANMALSFSQNVVKEEFTQPSEQCQDFVTPSTSGIEHDKKKCSGKNKKVEHLEEQAALKKAIDVLNKPQDDYSVFGDYVASELRQLRSDENRKILKRTIMKAIIEMGEKEDLEYSSSTSTPIPPCSSPESYSNYDANVGHGTTT